MHRNCLGLGLRWSAPHTPIITFSCLQATRLAEKELFAPLSVRERVEDDLHLKQCVLCRDYRHQRDLVNTWIKHQTVSTEARTSMPDSLKRALQKELEQRLAEGS